MIRLNGLIDFLMGLVWPPPKRAIALRRHDGSIMIEVSFEDGTRRYLRNRYESKWYAYPSMESLELSSIGGIGANGWLAMVERYCDEHGGPWPDAHLGKPITT